MRDTVFLPESVMVVPDEAGLPATARRKTMTVHEAIFVAASGRARTYGAGLKVLGTGMEGAEEGKAVLDCRERERVARDETRYRKST